MVVPAAIAKPAAGLNYWAAAWWIPNVFGFVDYDPKRTEADFAFGMGVEWIVILKYGVDDIQLFFNGDVRFLEQFG